MKLRQFAVAFLINENQEVLFLQKKLEGTFLAGFLVPIGGHIEGHEMNEPQNACIREIEEETGIKSDLIKNLSLRYIVHRVKDNKEIRIQYVFFGSVPKSISLIESDEGSLTWVRYEDIGKQHVSVTTQEIVKHYAALNKDSKKVYVGSMKSLKGEPEITWALLEDWELSSLNK
ncbi:MAG: NUDIX domain-containing protein [Bacillaceae bacterium]|nr:NUDIX domain-containing protein [Bacillaceae bacterium]